MILNKVLDSAFKTNIEDTFASFTRYVDGDGASQITANDVTITLMQATDNNN